MKHRWTCLTLLVLAQAPATAALADCDLSVYDRTAPTAIKSELDNGTAHFDWATDVDTVNGRNWIWHYIKNLDPNRGLGYRWPKANLRRALGSPLQPGRTDCNRYFVTSKFGADDNAPITYGTNEAQQRAAVYMETTTGASGPNRQSNAAEPIAPPSEPGTGSMVETSYSTKSGDIEIVRVAISTAEGKTADARWYLQIERTPNVSIGISMLPRLLNEQQFRVILDQFGRQSVRVGAFDLRKITGKDEKESLAGLFSEDEIPARSDQVYLVLDGDGASAAKAVAPAAALRPISTDLILFDRERRPFFATTLRLLVPDNAR